MKRTAILKHICVTYLFKNKRIAKLEKQYPRIFKRIQTNTAFLRPDAIIQQRLWHIINDKGTRIFCQECNEHEVRWQPNLFTYNKTCSKKCATFFQQKAKNKTLVEKYGVSNPSNIETAKQKRIQTFQTRYGVDNPRKHSKVKERIVETKKKIYGDNLELVNEKIKQTNLERYGTEWYSQTSEFAEKTKQTVRIRYGVDSIAQLEAVQQQRQMTNRERYGCDHYSQTDECKERIRQTNRERYGVDHHSQTAAFRDKVAGTHEEKYGKHFHQQHLTDDTLSMLSDREWLLDQHHTQEKTVLQISEELGVSWTLVDRRLNQSNIAHKHFFQSSAEREIVEYISEMLPSEQVLTRVTSIIDGELDIFLPDRALAIEINGTFWHSELNGKGKNYHLNKLKQCESRNIRLMQFTNVEWKEKRAIVESIITNALKATPQKINARECIIRECSREEAREFFDSNHIQGSSSAAGIFIGLIHNGTPVFMLGIGPSRYNKTYQYEIIRMCSKKMCIVRGGASKCLTYFKRTYTPVSILSYMNLQHGNASVPAYANLGFRYLHRTPPGYQYFSRKNSMVLYPRQMFQKHKLSRLLETFDSSLTEWENMKNNGYDRVWDCGNDVFVWSHDE